MKLKPKISHCLFLSHIKGRMSFPCRSIIILLVTGITNACKMEHGMPLICINTMDGVSRQGNFDNKFGCLASRKRSSWMSYAPISKYWGPCQMLCYLGSSGPCKTATILFPNHLLVEKQSISSLHESTWELVFHNLFCK